MAPDQKTDDMIAWLEASDVESVECLIPDFAGTPRGKSIPVAKFLESLGTDTLRAPESIFSQTVNGEFIVNDYHSGLEHDIILKPDMTTLAPIPFSVDPSAAVICDTEQKEGRVDRQSPRSVLQRMVKKFNDEGWQPIVAPEFEFYLIELETDDDGRPRPPVGYAGRRSTASQDHLSVDAKNAHQEYFSELKSCCNDQHIAVESLIGEAGPGQFEMNLLYGTPVSVADQSFYFKRAVREIARRHNIVATFVARPYPRSYGSSMHLHQSLVDLESGKNVFADKDGGDSDLLLSYIAGLQTYLPAAMIFLAPYINSYGRFGTGLSVPANTAWGHENRTAALRIPEGGRESRRVENRIAGSDVNPYLAFAASLACGYLGMKQGLKPTPEATGHARDAKGAKPLPRHILDAMDALEESEEMHELLGNGFVNTFLDIKRKEFASHFDYLSPWEIKFLLHSV